MLKFPGAGRVVKDSQLAVLWPVCVRRVRVRASFQQGEVDPFTRVVLDLARVGVTDLLDVVRATGLPRELLTSVRDAAVNQGYVDDAGAVSDVGIERLQDLPIDDLRTGWMFIDGVSGTVLPQFVDQLPAFIPDDDDAERVSVGHPRSPKNSEYADALYRSVSSGKRPQVVLLGDGEWTWLRVILHVDAGRPASGEGMRHQAWCPFEETETDDRYIQRLGGFENGRTLLRQLEDRARSAYESEAASHARAQISVRIDELTADLEGLAIPDHVTEHLREALGQHLRADVGEQSPDSALTTYGKVAEDLLMELAPRDDEAMSPAQVGRLAERLPKDGRARIDLLDEAIKRLHAGLTRRRHLEGEASRLMQELGRGGRLRCPTHGVALQLRPIALAALAPGSAHARRVVAVLDRHPELWADLQRVLAHRNPASHGGKANLGRKPAEQLVKSQAAVLRCVAAVWAESEPTALTEPEAALSALSFDDYDEEPF